MANTTNFGWETPDDTDLVKDGAAAMRTLGNAIDASLVDLKGGTTGQVLSKNTNTDMDFVWTTPQTGDITAVTAGTGLSGGGTSGDVTLTNTVATTFDAKGDLVVGTGADTFAKLTVGANNTVLVADSATSTGLKWATVSSGALTLITQGTFSSTAGINIDNCFTSTYTNYLVVWDRITSASVQGQFQFRSGGTTNTNTTYNWSSYYIAIGSSPLAYETGASQDKVSTGIGEATNITSVTMLYVFQPQQSQHTTFTWTNQHGGGYTQWGGGKFSNTTSFDGIRLAPSSGNFTSGSYQVYGLAKS